MTWKEFKEVIEEQMIQKGISEEVEIVYIDISYPCTDHEACRPEVYHDRDSIVIH